MIERAPAGGVEALLFDLGGVVIDIDFGRAAAVWAAHAGVDPQRLLTRFHADIDYERHERGELTAPAYFESLRASLGIDLSDAQFLQGWNAIFKGEVDGLADLLREAATHFPLYAFSNSNEAHKRVWSVRFAPLLRHFSGVFVSCDIGRRKPEPQAYEWVVNAIGVPAGAIFFFDDSAPNVSAAGAAGLRAACVRSADEIRACLADSCRLGYAPGDSGA